MSERFIVRGRPHNTGWFVYDRRWNEEVILEYIDSELADIIAAKMNERAEQGKDPATGEQIG
jgi:hypothetical protein